MCRDAQAACTIGTARLVLQDTEEQSAALWYTEESSAAQFAVLNECTLVQYSGIGSVPNLRSMLRPVATCMGI